MDPITLGVSAVAHAILGSIDWHKIGEGLIGDGVKEGRGYLLRRIRPTDRQKTAQKAVALFVEEFVRELDDKVPLTRSSTD